MEGSGGEWGEIELWCMRWLKVWLTDEPCICRIRSGSFLSASMMAVARLADGGDDMPSELWESQSVVDRLQGRRAQRFPRGCYASTDHVLLRTINPAGGAVRVRMSVRTSQLRQQVQLRR